MRKLPVFFVSFILICLNFILINQADASIFVISGTISEPAPNVFVGTSFDESNSFVVINEFVYNPSAGGNEWVELFNKTGEDISLENWQLVDGNADADDLTLTGILPANGILVFEKSGGGGWLNNTAGNGSGDIIYLKNNGTTIDQVTYQRQANGTTINNTSAMSNTSAGQSIYRTSDGGANWNAASTPTKGWFNSGTSVATVVSAINGAGITTNLGTSDITNPSAASGFYFEKTGKGKITFSGILNLTDAGIVSLLQNLATKMDLSATGHIAFDASTAVLFKNAGATLVMYGLDQAGFTGTPEIIVKDDSGNIIAPGSGNYPVISGISFSGGNLTFSSSHFSQYDAKKIKNTATGKGFDTIQSAIDDPETLAGHTVNVSAGSYAETVTINKAITISGSGNPSAVKFILTANPVVISGFNVSGIEVSGSGKIQDAGVFSLPSGQVDLTNTSQVNIDRQTTLNISVSGGTSSVTLPAGINITKTDGGNIDSTLLSAANISTGSLSGLGSGVAADGALQWGIPDIGLTFSGAITLNIYVGSSFNGQTLNILRSTSTSSGWTSDGIIAPATCVVSSGTCTFQATKASYYAATHTASSDSGGGSSNNSDSSGGGDGLSDGLGCANHDCSIHPVTALQTQSSNPVTPAAGFQNNVLGALIDNTILSSEPSTSSYSASITPSPTGGVKGIASTTSNNWWLLFFGAGGLVLLFWFAKRKIYS